MRNAATIYFVRHGETMWNRAGRHQGHEDSPLTLKGIGQVRAVAALLQRELAGGDGYSLICSPLFRTRQTAAILCDSLGLDFASVRFDDRLKERGYGRWSGLTDAEIIARYPEDWAARCADRFGHSVPDGGESYAELTGRVEAWLGDLVPGETALVVSHGGTGRALRGLYLGLPPTETVVLAEPQTSVFKFADGVVSELRADFDGSPG